MKPRGFTLTELLIAGLLSVTVVAAAMHVITKFMRTTQESDLQAGLSLKGSQLRVILSSLVEPALYLEGETIAGTHFGEGPSFGLMRFPFEAPGESVSDGLQIFALDSSASTSSSFQVTEITLVSGDYRITVSGDFVPTKTLEEDLILMKVGTTSELFTLKSSVSHSGGLPGTSTFTVEESAEAFIDFLLHPSVAGHPEVMRVSRRVLRIGNGSDVASGLFLLEQGSARLIERDVTSMRVFYELSARLEAAEADCESKQLARYLPLAADSSECHWTDVAGVRLELVLESLANTSKNSEHPHTGQIGKSAKHLQIVQVVPGDYLQNLMN